MPHSSDGERHIIQALIVDFRNFNPSTGTAADIEIKEVNTEVMSEVIGNKKIKQLKLVYNNIEAHKYELELLILIVSQDP